MDRTIYREKDILDVARLLLSKRFCFTFINIY